MKRIITLFTSITISLILIGAVSVSDQKPVLSLEGTYRLVSRELPDGTMQYPPDVAGLLTYTKSHRNFNVMWKDKVGKLFSISYIATYELTSSEYRETSVYRMVNDEISGAGIQYDFSEKSSSAPITFEKGQFKFTYPLFDEPTIFISGDSAKAIGPGFVDYWEKVD